MSQPKHVKIVEVGPRDGLQNEIRTIAVNQKIELINMLSDSGLNAIEVGSMVSPQWVPQMADSAEVLTAINKRPGASYSVLVPNMRGLDAAIKAGATEIAIFAAASESFSQKNINCSIAQSLQRYQEVCETAIANNIKVRGYVSCVVACPYEGAIATDAVTRVALALEQMGCYEISLGETIGVATPGTFKPMLDAVLTQIDRNKVAIHCHDTYGQALVNIYAALQLGVHIVDSSIAGLGGCPYAPGASGNVATEDLLYLLNGLGIETGVNLEQLCKITSYISNELGIEPRSKVAKALLVD